MADVVEREGKNKMNAHNIAMVFAPRHGRRCVCWGGGLVWLWGVEMLFAVLCRWVGLCFDVVCCLR